MADLNGFIFNNDPSASFFSPQSGDGFFFTNDQNAGVDSSVLSWIPAKVTGSLVRVTFVRNLRSLAATTVPANYTISGPSAITVDSVAFTPGTNIVDLTVSGTFSASGGYYTLNMASNTAQAADDENYNSTVAQRFISPATGGAGGSSKLNAGFN